MRHHKSTAVPIPSSSTSETSITSHQCQCSTWAATSSGAQHRQLFQLLTGWRDWRRNAATIASDDGYDSGGDDDDDATDDENHHHSCPHRSHRTTHSRRVRRSPHHRTTTSRHHNDPFLWHHLLWWAAIAIVCLAASNIGGPKTVAAAAGQSMSSHGVDETMLYANWSTAQHHHHHAKSSASTDQDMSNIDTDVSYSKPSEDAPAAVPITIEPQPDDAESAVPINVGCSACRMRQHVEDLSIDSFKTHILQRLHLDQAPNGTKKAVVTDSVLHNFYSENGYRYIRLKSAKPGATVAGKADDQQMQSDEPPRRAIATQQRTRHHSGRRQGPNDRHPEATAIIYEDEYGEYEVDEEYYEPLRPGATSFATRRHHRGGGGGAGRRQHSSAAASSWRSTADSGDFSADDDDGYGDGDADGMDDRYDYRHYPNHRGMESGYEVEDDGQYDDRAPYVDQFFSSTHSMFAFPKGE